MRSVVDHLDEARQYIHQAVAAQGAGDDHRRRQYARSACSLAVEIGTRADITPGQYATAWNYAAEAGTLAR